MFNAINHHVALSVGDLDAAQRWYEKALGLREEQRFEMASVRTVLLGSAGLRVELIEREGSVRGRSFVDAFDASGARGYGHWALQVDDLNAAYGDLTGAGAQPVSAPAPAVQEGARFAYVKDPEGNLLELIQA